MSNEATAIAADVRLTTHEMRFIIDALNAAHPTTTSLAGPDMARISYNPDAADISIKLKLAMGEEV